MLLNGGHFCASFYEALAYGLQWRNYVHPGLPGPVLWLTSQTCRMQNAPECIPEHLNPQNFLGGGGGGGRETCPQTLEVVGPGYSEF